MKTTSPRAAARLAWALCALTWLAVLAAVGLGLLNGPAARPEEQRSLSEVLVGGAAVATFATFGALVSARHTRNAVGWILCVAALAMALALFAGEYALYGLLTEPDSLPVAEAMAWLTEWIWIPAMLVVNTLLLLFPDGRLPSPRWRVVPWVAALGMIGVAFHEAFSPGTLTTFPLDNPYPLEGGAGRLAEALAASYALVNVAALGSVTSLAVRLRRSRGDERQQLKWLASGGVVLLLGIVLSNVAIDSLLPVFFGLVMVAVAVAVGVFKYRLYDIDVVINRTLVYGALTASLAAVYGGSVLMLQLVLSGVTQGSGFAVATSTLGVAALFRPARGRIQQAVDHRFYRRKYDARRTLEGFGVRLRDEVDLDALASELRGVVRQTMQPAHVSLWLRPPAGKP